MEHAVHDARDLRFANQILNTKYTALSLLSNGEIHSIIESINEEVDELDARASQAIEVDEFKIASECGNEIKSLREMHQRFLGRLTTKAPNGRNELAQKLRESAKALHEGTSRPDLAEFLLSLATATEYPSGYTLKVLGAINHEFFLSTPSGIEQAAKDEGYSGDEFTIVPLVAVPLSSAE